jgi:alkyl sulfatase BDS1-like metallo-beta-lactamase superfamily hydrolase
MNEVRELTCLELVAAMAQRFDPTAARGQEGEIQFIFSGEESVTCYLRLTKSGCTFHRGEALYPKLTIRVDSGVWKAIMRGDITWERAMMERHFLATGNFPLLAQMPRLFQMG